MREHVDWHTDPTFRCTRCRRVKSRSRTSPMMASSSSTKASPVTTDSPPVPLSYLIKECHLPSFGAAPRVPA